MRWLGLPLAQLLPLAAGAAGAVVLLYVLKLRRRRVVVPYSILWQRVLRDRDASTWFSRLKRLLSLLLQLLLLALVFAALGDPRLTASWADGRSVVILVDASASMQATDVLPSRLAGAQVKLREMIAGLGANDRLLIAQMDASVTPLSPLSGDRAELERAAERLRATDTRADLRRALGFAADSLRGVERPEVVVLSDGALGDAAAAGEGLLEGVPVSWLRLGSEGSNVGLTGLSVRRYPLDKSRAEVRLQLDNAGAEPATVELSLYGDGRLIDVSTLELKPGERLPRYYQDLAGADRTLEAVARVTQGRDLLPADDRGYALVPERRRARVCVVTRGNTYLEAALLLDEYLDVTLVPPERYPVRGGFDVTLFDGVAPPVAEDAGAALYLALPAQGGPLRRGRRLEGFGFDSWDAKSPALRYLALGDVQVATGYSLRPEPGDRVLGASDQGPLLVGGRRDGRPFLALGFDPRDSDWVLRPAWPLFILNAIDSFGEDDASFLSSYPTGQPWYLPVPAPLERVSLLGPAGDEREVPVRGGHAVVFGEHAGFFTLRSAATTPPFESRFAANLAAPEESKILPPEALDLGRPLAPLPSFDAKARRELWHYLLLAAAVLSASEWLSYHRRLTV